MKRTCSAAYLNIYLPKYIADDFRSHCNKNGLIMSATVTILIKEFLEKAKRNG